MRGIEGVEDWHSRRLLSPMLKTASFILLILLGATLTALHAADTPAKPKAVTSPEFVAITDDPKLPRVLLMGDSVSIAYALEVRKLLVAVRYAWKDWPDYSLANGAGLPASPFRTDDWPEVKK